jgi:hypothetical protein
MIGVEQNANKSKAIAGNEYTGLRRIFVWLQGTTADA